MARPSRRSAESAPAEQPVEAAEPKTADVAATEDDDARDLDFERYVSDLAAVRESGPGRPTMYLRADVVAARAETEA